MQSFQRKVFSDPPRNIEEANRRNAQARFTSGYIWAGEHQIAWMKDGDVFNASNQKLATLDGDGNLYSIDGQPLYLCLEVVNGGGRIGNDAHPQALARFKALVAGEVVKGFA
jgi:hypothetical protein